MITRTVEFEHKELLALDSALITAWQSITKSIEFGTSVGLTQLIAYETDALAMIEVIWAKSQMAQMGNDYKFMTLAKLDEFVKANA